MTILYNAHTDGDNYRITKFNDGEVESSYLCSTTECQCPAGHRPSCRHRLMLPMFIARGAVDSWWFLDFERKGWVSNEPADSPTLHSAPIQQEHLDMLYPSKRSEGYRGFESKAAYEAHYSDVANYKDEFSSMEEYVKEAESERSEFVQPTPSPELTGLQEEQILMGFHQPELVREMKTHPSTLPNNMPDEHDHTVVVRLPFEEPPNTGKWIMGDGTECPPFVQPTPKPTSRTAIFNAEAPFKLDLKPGTVTFKMPVIDKMGIAESSDEPAAKPSWRRV